MIKIVTIMYFLDLGKTEMKNAFLNKFGFFCDDSETGTITQIKKIITYLQFKKQTLMKNKNDTFWE